MRVGGVFVSGGLLGGVRVCVRAHRKQVPLKKRERKKKGMASDKSLCFPSEKHAQMDADSAPFLFFFSPQGVCGMNICMRGRTSTRRSRVDEQNVYTPAAAAATVVIKT